MRQKLIKNITVLTLITVSLFTFVSCGSKDKGVKAKKTDMNLNIDKFDTQVINIDDWSFEIPNNWQEMNGESEDTYYYAPVIIEENANTSNVNVVIKKSENQPSIDELVNNVDEAIVEKIVEVMPKATGFKYDELKSDIGDVLSIEYDVSDSGVDMHITQFLILAEGYSIAVTSNNINDGAKPLPEDVAKYIVDTIQYMK